MPQNDLACENWRSRERSWDFARVALEFFRDERIPFHEMEHADRLVGNPAEDNRRYAFAKRGEVYLVYLPKGGSADLDLSGITGPVHGASGSTRARAARSRTARCARSPGDARVSLGAPPADPGR